MKCIYCNAEDNLTSSDIISYAITGAKLTKSFVCQTHNQYTNDTYEKEFIAGLDFYRNMLGLTTRDGKPIQYTADLTIGGLEIHDVKISDRQALYSPKDVVVGRDEQGKKVILAPQQRLEKFKNANYEIIDISDAMIHKTMSSDSFTNNEALHSIAKIAYEWYCYIHCIEEYIENKYEEIVSYILNNENREDIVTIVNDGRHYTPIDYCSEIGTNSFYEYDDSDGYRYVVFDLWNTIAYKVRICKSDLAAKIKYSKPVIALYQYRIDGSSRETIFAICQGDFNTELHLSTLNIKKLTLEEWSVFVKRLEKLGSTFILTLRSMFPKVRNIEANLSKFENGQIELAHLLDFEDSTTIGIIQVLNILYENRTSYNFSESFSKNIQNIFALNDTTLAMNQEQKRNFLLELKQLNQEGILIDYMKNGISIFYQIYQNEQEKNEDLL